MKVEQLYTGCLSEAAYYIESNGEAAIIDPLRDYQSYIDKAREDNATIKYVFETHFHADFVSGHIDLGRQTGAPIIYGPGTGGTRYPVTIATDKQRFPLGACTIEVLHTPGHTIESTCFLLYDENNKPYCIFTGDTLFVGDVGRPDLSSGDMSTEELASIMYDSLNNVIIPLADDIIMYPAHGPGSACGKNLGPETYSTIGEQKRTNYALQPMTREEFVQAVSTGISPAPKYFSINAGINKNGYMSFDEVMQTGVKPLTADEVATLNERTDVTILDTRKPEDFELGFIPTSINIGLNGRFAEWVGSIIPFAHTVVLVCDPGKENEAMLRMARVGFDKVAGYLQGGFEAWRNAGKPVDMVITIDADEVAMDLPFEPVTILDVRKQGEYDGGHITGAKLIPLAELEDKIEFLDTNQTYYVHCAAGYRSMIAMSILKKHGFERVKNIQGGWGEIIKNNKIPVDTAKAVMN